jgi:hypothetical protein
LTGNGFELSAFLEVSSDVTKTNTSLHGYSGSCRNDFNSSSRFIL